MTLKDETSPKIDPDRLKRARNAFNISVVTTVLFALIVIVSLVINRSLTSDLITTASLSVTMLVAVVSAQLSRRGKSDLGILLLLGTLMLVVASRVFVQKGLGIPTGIVHIILVSSIAIYTLPTKWISRVVGLAFLNAVITIIIDQYTVGIPASPSPDLAIAISVILGVIYLIILGTQFAGLPLRAKLIIGFLLLTTLPLIILGWQTNITTRAILEQQIRTSILELSSSTSANFRAFVDSQTVAMRKVARLPEIVDYMLLPRDFRSGSDTELAAQDKLAELSKNDLIFIKSYALVDLQGLNILDTLPANVGTSYASKDFFTNVIESRKQYVSALELAPKTDDQNIYFAAPIVSKSNDMLGVLVVTYNAKFFQPSIDQLLRENRTPLTADLYVLDANNFFILGHSKRVDSIFKTLLSAGDPRLAALQEQGQIDPARLDSIVLSQPETVAQLTGMGEVKAFRAPAWEYDGDLAEVSAVRVPNSNWIVVAAQPVSSISAITETQTRTAVITSIIITALAALIALVVSNLFTSPLIELTRVAEDISTGDYNQKAKVRAKDEIGVLASTFNKMSSQIQDLVSGLEQRVEQRTSELESASHVSENRARQLQSIAEIARYISTEKDLTKLLPLVTRSVSERFGFYHIGIFLMDETGKFAVLRAANSPGGQEMLRRQHRLEVGQTGIVGNVTSTGTPRIALETGADAIYFNNPNLPDTRSEMALPLRARGSIIGALDVQSTEPNAFTDADITILSLLADQIAIAIDNARLIEEAQGLLAESRAVFNEYIAEAWQKKAGSAVLGYHQTLAGGKIITTQSAYNVEHDGSNGNKSFEVPIRVRNQVIGVLNVKSVSTEREWNSEDMSVVEAVAERLGLALDNARLFEETSTRASRERLVTEITTRIRGTNDPQEMIKTAVEELQRALGATRVEIVPRKAVPPPDK